MPKLMEKPSYRIFILDPDEFNDLHKYIPEVSKKDLEEGLGFANPKTGECYVKRTGVKEWDDETVLHEAQELLAKHSEHEIENIRWKKGGQIIRNVVSGITALIPGVGPILAGAMQAGHGAYEMSKDRQTLGSTLLGTGLAVGGGMLGQSSAGYKAGVEASKAAGGGIIGQTLSGTKGLLGMTPSATTPAVGTVTGPWQGSLLTSPSAQSALKSAVLPAATGAITGAYTGSLLTPPAEQAALKTSLLGNAASGLSTTGTTPATGGIMKQLGTKATEFLKSPTNILGAVSTGASMLPKTPAFQMPSYVSDLQTKLMSGGSLSPLGEQAKAELSQIMKSTPQELYPTGTDAYYGSTLKNLDNEYAKQKEALARQWNAIDPNYQRNGEYIMADQELNKSYMEVKNNFVAQEEQRRFELARTTKYQAIQDSLGVDKNTMDDIVGLTGLDVQTAAMVYGAQVADIQAIRDALGTLGTELLFKGQGTDNTTGMKAILGSILGK